MVNVLKENLRNAWKNSFSLEPDDLELNKADGVKSKKALKDDILVFY